MTVIRGERRPAVTKPTAGSRRHARSSRIATPYLLLLPAAAMYALFTVYPLFRQFDISFYNWHVFPGASNPFTGLANYRQVLTDPVVRTATFNTVLYLVVTVPIQMLLGLIAAAAPSPEPLGGTLFTRVTRRDDLVAVSLIDLTGSAAGRWNEPSGQGSTGSATVDVLVDQPASWTAEIAILGSSGGRFQPVSTSPTAHREGNALRFTVPLGEGWAIARLRRTGT